MVLLKKVTELQKPDGHLDAEQTSITGSGGRDLQIETTALAVLGWLKANPGEFNASVQKAINWIGQQRGGYGGFGSTQSTILALKALILYTKANKKTPESGELHLFVGDASSRGAAVRRRRDRAADAERARRRDGAEAGQERRARRDHRQERLPVHADLVVSDAATRQCRQLPGEAGDEARPHGSPRGRDGAVDRSRRERQRQGPGHGGGHPRPARRSDRSRRT